MTTWTDPKVFAESNNVNATVLNVYLSENLRYLASRPLARTLLADVGTWTTSSTSFTVVDSAIRVSMETQRLSDIMIEFDFAYSIASTSERLIHFDVQMDGDLWLSTGTSTGSSDGAYLVSNHSSNGNKAGATMRMPFLQVTAGEHYFDLHWKVSSANTITIYTNPTFLFSAKEET